MEMPGAEAVEVAADFLAAGRRAARFFGAGGSSLTGSAAGSVGWAAGCDGPAFWSSGIEGVGSVVGLGVVRLVRGATGFAGVRFLGFFSSGM
jgi:hypothetical protein